MTDDVKHFFAERAWINGAWANDVLLSVDGAGAWCGVQAGKNFADASHAKRLSGAVLPGLVNAHSHAFQRSIAGLTETVRFDPNANCVDDFWSWRERMFAAALRITPDQLEGIAAYLYAELLQGGYTHVCEFHYLHNAPDGSAYADPLELSRALMRAAQRTGIGLTLLPTLYMRSGFGATGLRPEQRRFASTPDSILKALAQLQTERNSLFNCGVGLHSLRAVHKGAMLELLAGLPGSCPVHIHIAEQTVEVRDCIAHYGARPVEWLLQNAFVNSQWNLVHATHTTALELAGVSASGAAVVICPSTEANLGDGIFDLPAYGAQRGSWSIGSDSHIGRSWPEELRLLEYSQRLSLRQRNVAATSYQVPQLSSTSSAAVLFEAALSGGAQAVGSSGAAPGQIALGNRADFVVLDARSPALAGVPCDQLLDALVFSSPSAAFSAVFVAGKQCVSAGRWSGAVDFNQLQDDYSRIMTQLWMLD